MVLTGLEIADFGLALANMVKFSKLSEHYVF